MRREINVTAERVLGEEARREVVEVLRATYQVEKDWIREPEAQITPADLRRQDMSWFLARSSGRPAGVMRVLYDPPVEGYEKYGLKRLDTAIDIDAFLRRNRIVEIGRFAVLPQYRGGILVAASLMRAATSENIRRGYTHLITDVFEDDRHSPYGFHTRVIGFHPVATHEVGELNCRSRRITLVLDIRAAYKRLRAQGNWMYRYLTHQWDDALHQAMAA